MRPVIVEDDRWRDFACEGCRSQIGPDGRVQFAGDTFDVTIRIRIE